MDTSLQQLIETVQTGEFEDLGWLSLTSATWNGPDVSLHLVMHQQGEPDQMWRIDCRGVRTSQIGNGPVIYDLAVKTEHPLLLPHVAPVAQLLFRGRPVSADALMGELMTAFSISSSAIRCNACSKPASACWARDRSR